MVVCRRRNLEAGVAPVASFGRVEVSLSHLEAPDPAIDRERDPGEIRLFA